MSSETDIAVLKGSIENIEKSMAQHNQDDRERYKQLDTRLAVGFDQVYRRFDLAEERLDERLEALDKRFSGKWVETAITSALYTVGGVIILAIMSLVVIKSQ